MRFSSKSCFLFPAAGKVFLVLFSSIQLWRTVAALHGCPLATLHPSQYLVAKSLECLGGKGTSQFLHPLPVFYRWKCAPPQLFSGFPCPAPAPTFDSALSFLWEILLTLLPAALQWVIPACDKILQHKAAGRLGAM